MAFLVPSLLITMILALIVILTLEYTSSTWKGRRLPTLYKGRRGIVKINKPFQNTAVVEVEEISKDENFHRVRILHITGVSYAKARAIYEEFPEYLEEKRIFWLEDGKSGGKLKAPK